jgi:DNA-binding FrmR family transcriptional regulator
MTHCSSAESMADRAWRSRYAGAYPLPLGVGYAIIESEDNQQEVSNVKDDVREDVLKRLNYIDGHLAGVRRMIEEDKYCPDVLKQTFAVRRAIEKMEAIILEGHLHTCVIDGVKNGREEQMVQEMLELYTLANR